ncbi:bifunctional 3-(3-hydroxy-phenyl)propionate/3-hydroxycinnamic acid hydroxylase [Acinetobacter sp. S40]|uniref:bifunctional 3-(3-hydroxy-phenyl)propionate/3-hydroxycinnamic acid hydroxylase n=1 Tax=Acinetobacter sp. S40 TaxID=2767434 RepID=UPI00190BCE83|nr:bifunctional 3-(3-hydroxy-phenyl)propionate/3-hydroxycinnamic acid hydroxylase [Acinetobacter sp. S40]MBJ9984689.1 bifunctional 3-(3-hydroxy-phenyl)propionate/3-hydroxycinnamic acid hydroxylase [Acinetobacter sp. S40]
MVAQQTDVIIVGFGPVSAVLALNLARKGHQVQIFERWTERYPLPRAICIDHEMRRMLLTLGLEQQLETILQPGELYKWVNADWKELITFDWTRESISGGAEVNFIHQPSFEKLVENELKNYPNVDVRLGYEVLNVEQNTQCAQVVAQNLATEQTDTYSARFVVGADGANSIVRQSIDANWFDKGFQADWLVVDIIPNEDAPNNIPTEATQYCNPGRPTTIAPAGLFEGKCLRRWEFMRLPHESVADLENEEKVWELLKPWVTPEQATLIRFKLYNFKSLISQKWCEDRILIAGDAAHVMPPFMGQGMCAGFRDALNLSWKISGILNHQYSNEILGTYFEERSPHVNDVIELSMFLGKVICVSDSAEAQQRDQAFFDGIVPPPPNFPDLTHGILAQEPKFNPQQIAGKLSPHSILQCGAVRKRLDDLIAGKFALLTLDPTSVSIFYPDQLKVISLLDEQSKDVQQVMIEFMQQHNIQAMLVRPDFYIFGAVEQTENVQQLVSYFEDYMQQYQIGNVAVSA